MAERDAPKPYFVKFDGIDIKLHDGGVVVSYSFAGEEVISQRISGSIGTGDTLSLSGFEGFIDIAATTN